MMNRIGERKNDELETKTRLDFGNPLRRKPACCAVIAQRSSDRWGVEVETYFLPG